MTIAALFGNENDLKAPTLLTAYNIGYPTKKLAQFL